MDPFVPVHPVSALYVVYLPAQADHFKQYQQQCCEQLKSQLWSHWLPKCADIFRRLPPVFINDDSAAYYR